MARRWASIAAVAQVEIKTRPADEELGTLLVVEGSDVKRQSPWPARRVPIFCVKNLFYNMITASPQLLKSNPVERRKHIIEGVPAAGVSYFLTLL